MQYQRWLGSYARNEPAQKSKLIELIDEKLDKAIYSGNKSRSSKSEPYIKKHPYNRYLNPILIYITTLNSFYSALSGLSCALMKSNGRWHMRMQIHSPFATINSIAKNNLSRGPLRCSTQLPYGISHALLNTGSWRWSVRIVMSSSIASNREAKKIHVPATPMNNHPNCGRFLLPPTNLVPVTPARSDTERVSLHGPNR